jgi:opacity protein-like surface antigen
LLVCLAFASSPAWAQSDDFARRGAYLGVAGTYAIYTKAEDELEDAFGGVFGDVDLDNPFGLNARAGYRFHSHFAAEGEFEWLSEADFDTDGAGSGNLPNGFVFTANGKAYALKGRFQPYVMAGPGFMIVDGDGSDDLGGEEADFAARFGAGLDIYITRNILVDLHASYVLPVDDLEDLDFVSIGWGFGYRF